MHRYELGAEIRCRGETVKIINTDYNCKDSREYLVTLQGGNKWVTLDSLTPRDKFYRVTPKGLVYRSDEGNLRFEGFDGYIKASLGQKAIDAWLKFHGDNDEV